MPVGAGKVQTSRNSALMELRRSLRHGWVGSGRSGPWDSRQRVLGGSGGCGCHIQRLGNLEGPAEFFIVLKSYLGLKSTFPS